MKRLAHVVRKTTHSAHGLRVLARAGMVSGLSVGRALGALKEVRQWGPLVSAVRYSAGNYPDTDGLVDEEGALTYRELDRISDALADAWQEQGFAPGDTMALLCRNHRWLLVALLACGKLGVHALLLNTGFAGPQLADVLNREQVQALIYDDDFTPAVIESRVRIPRFVAWAGQSRPGIGRVTLEALAENAATTRSRRPPVVQGHVVLLTSGTTGRPKGARRDIRSGLTAADFLDRIPLRSRESTFIAAPMFHAVGFSQLLVGCALGATLVVHRRFDAAQVIRSVRENHCTALVLVPTMLQRVLAQPQETLASSLESLRVVLVSGSPLLPALCERALNSLGDVVYNLYGSTEAAVVSVATPDELRAAPGTVGRPPRTCTLHLRDESDTQVTRAFTSGRIFAGGSLTFSGYTGSHVRNPPGGLVDTGDRGHLNEQGLLFVDGRADDMIISGGENVFPSEVEDLIARHYLVKDVAVIGVADHEFGQRLRAFVVPLPGTDITGDEIRWYVRESLARHKVPREVFLVERIPRNATGKVRRNELLEYQAR